MAANEVMAWVGFDYEANVAADTDGNIIDLQGYDPKTVTVITYIDTVDTADNDNYFDILVEMGDDDAMADGANLAAADYIDGPTRLNSQAAGVDDTVQRYGIKPSNTLRYMRVHADETGAADATFAVVVTAEALRKPTA